MSAFKAYADVIAKLRVPSGFLLVLAFLWLSQPDRRSLAIGLPVSILGLLLRGWATGHVEKNIRLAQSGPYTYVRNPLYLGTALVAAGLVIASQRWLLAAIFAAVFLAVYLPVIELEEQHLRSLFPEFRTYAERVPKLRPTFGFKAARRNFRWDLYWHNREYQASLGFLGGAAFLVGKAWLRVNG
jgi:protein-S-isoprenylcysteine O-methyltransferase Ste14